MSTRVGFEYVAPFTYSPYRLEENAFAFEDAPWEEEEENAAAPDPGAEEASRNDLGFFMNLAGRYPLLSAAEERRLGNTMWLSRLRLLRLLRRARKSSGRRSIPIDPVLGEHPVTASTRRRLARVERLARELGTARGFPASGRNGARARVEATLLELDEARRSLVEHNLRLVVWVAKRFRGRGFDFIDLIQEGSLGLMRAVDRYDPRVGARFSTFATHWIQQGIRRALAEKARFIRIPVNRIPEVRQAQEARSRLATKLGRPPLPEEIANAMGAPVAKLEELLPALVPIDSIDGRIAQTEKLLGETLFDRNAPTPLEDAIEEETRRAVKAVLDELPNRQRIILSMRHGIGYPRACTLDEIGDALGLSRERIRQVEKAATAAVRDWIRKNRPQLAEPV